MLACVSTCRAQPCTLLAVGHQCVFERYDCTEMRTEEHPEIPACLCTNDFARGRPGLDVSRISIISTGLGRKYVDTWVVVSCVDGRPWHRNVQNLSTPPIPNGLFPIPSGFQVTCRILKVPVSCNVVAMLFCLSSACFTLCIGLTAA
jgi:hypothetical protein